MVRDDFSEFSGGAYDDSLVRRLFLAQASSRRGGRVGRLVRTSELTQAYA